MERHYRYLGGRERLRVDVQACSQRGVEQRQLIRLHHTLDWAEHLERFGGYIHQASGLLLNCCVCLYREGGARRGSS